MTTNIISSSVIMSPRKRTLVPVSSRRKAADDYFPFNFLPVECQLHVLSFLNEVDKCSCALVCLSWSCLVRSWKLWRVADYSRRGLPPGQEGLLVSNREFERWKAWVHHYTHHLVSRRASLLTLKASFDLGDRCNKWSELLGHLLDHVHCRDLSHLDLNWTFTLLEPLDLRVHSSSSSHQDSITKMDQVTSFQELLTKLTHSCPRISKMRLHFDWSDVSMSLLTNFQQLRVLELKYFWVFKGVTPSTLQHLTRSLPNLKSLTLQILVPLRNLGISYTLESQSLEFLDVSPSRGLVFSCLKLPALRELRAKKIVRGITLDRRTRLRIQSRWPCLYHVLREGTPRLQALNNERLLPTWREERYGEMSAILEQSCYCEPSLQPEPLDTFHSKLLLKDYYSPAAHFFPFRHVIIVIVTTMSKNSLVTKAFAAAFVVLTASAIAGIVTMVILYKTQIATMNPTPRPTFPSTTTGLPPVMRLPKNLVPERYKVFLWPRFYSQIIEEVNVTSPNQTALFTGNTTVYFHCVQGTSSIYLHSQNLDVYGPVVASTDTDEGIRVTRMENHQDQTNFLEIELDYALKTGGNYSLFLAFRGEVSGGLEGMYGSTYEEGIPAHEDDTDTDRFLIATHMEPTSARSVFPCFDEPDFKAEFEVTIIHRRITTALANGINTDGANIIDDDWKATAFQSTPLMSTYLFAFTVSEFTPTPSSNHRTYARPEATKAGHAKYAADITGRILDYFERRFGIVYPQRKLDQIALPDLISDGMENLGLITYQEGELLYEEGCPLCLTRKTSLNSLHMNWHTRLEETTLHPLLSIIKSQKKKCQNDINIAFFCRQWFGNLVTIKWWNDIWLNEGFASYMTFYAVDAVEPDFKLKDVNILNNLHTAFEADALASSRPLSTSQGDVQTSSQIMEMFDIITYSVLVMLADLVDQPVFDKAIRRYLSDWKYKNTDQNILWEYIQKADDESTGKRNIAEVMNSWTKQIGYPVITINTTSGEAFQKHFLFNASAVSRYAPNVYPFRLSWHVPIRAMKYTTPFRIIWLKPGESAMKDEFVATKGEWILANVNCTGYYRRIPLMNRGQLIDDAFNLARAKLVNVTLALNITRFIRNETELIPWAATMSNLGYFVRMFDRSEVCTSVIRLKAFTILSATTQQFHSPTDHSSHIHPNLRSVIYCQAVAHGGKEEWEFAWDLYLDYTLDPELIRMMEVASSISYVSRNVAGQALAWNFIRAHWNYLERFAMDYDLGPASRVAYQAIEQTAVNIQWVSENKDVILEWFERETA
ncbi:hypothetical protein F7725_022278 [Dissostichus mawsoni]|uniref:F-box domain-containing protein n=1 Tax=Dissostichus mawsoni TaxID=36200 RepID=A0A7J5YYE2_DISMA|nr:hypothetical protein F7725_022278 [Dissostichus mawsoni]